MAKYQCDYFEDTMGFPVVYDGPANEIVDHMVEEGAWCIGTPDDLVDTINRLNEDSGGFGGIRVQASEWAATPEQTHRSYELMACYVMPQFQGSLTSLARSQEWASENRLDLMALRTKSLDAATKRYGGKK